MYVSHIIYQEAWQRDFVREFGRSIKIGHMDETHSVNQYRFPLTGVGSPDMHGNFVILAEMISSVSSQQYFELFLDQIKISFEGGFQPSTFFVDKSDAEIAAIQKIFPNARVRLCYWHAIEAWRRWLVKGVNGVGDKGTQQTIFEV